MFRRIGHNGNVQGGEKGSRQSEKNSRLKMNDISRLSYKELQALALRYRVPGNIKKKLLVKVLQAAKSGNENEVGRLLQDLKQNRKRKVRKSKAEKLGLTSTPVHSPDYIMADDYYCPQQQPPYQWVGAEEEIVSREDERIPHYEEFKQFLLKRIQREFQTYDANNNQIQDPNIVDLRTAVVPPDVPKGPLDSYNKSNIIAVNSNTDSFVYQPTDNVEYQTLEDTNSNVQGSILLKKMLQAPVGANLGEIASPVLGGYRFFTMEQYQSNNNLLDNSDTLTAESETQNTEENLENNPECYGLIGGIKGEFFLSEPTLVKNVEEIGQQMSVLTNENVNQYRYSSANVDMHQEYENWTITNVMGAADTNCAVSDGPSSKIFQTMYYDNIGSDTLSKPMNDENLTCQYRMNEHVHSYNSNHTLLNLNPSEENQYYEPNIIPSVQSDSSNTYYLQNLIKYSGDSNEDHLQNTHSLSNANMDQDAYPSTMAQTFSHNNNYNSNLSYEYSSMPHNQNSVPLSENLGQQEPNCSSVGRTDSSIQKTVSSTADKVQTNGILEPFWPRKFSKTPTNHMLENILNLISTKRIDLSRLEQTSCVYCYMAPIVTHTPVSSNVSCSQKERFVAEYRQHSFSPYWLLYNDTSCGMRMANLQAKLDGPAMEKPRALHMSRSNSNSDLRESVEESDDSIPEVWPNNYANYETTTEEDSNVCEDLNVEDTDCLFSVINTGPLVSHVDDVSKSQAQ